ncbi:MAG: polysaccharide biosynthesis protein, partial [Desulfovermiculus sp.]
TGLRPGEKIFEELITDEEGVVPTRHAKIMVLQRNSREFSKHEALDRRGFLRQVDDLVRAAASQDGEHIRRKLREVVPEYRLPA